MSEFSQLADLRKEYKYATLDERDAASDPMAQFAQWFAHAKAALVPEPSAMTLATVDADGKPSARIVLMKAANAQGITFFTNYESRKGQALSANAHAALLFFWPELERQVRIEGRVARVPEASSQAYYLSRPLGSRIGAWASAQSRPLQSRKHLQAAWDAAATLHGDHPPCPAHWGGYALTPSAFEFWQGRESRLHDRIAYHLRAGQWVRTRLAP